MDGALEMDGQTGTYLESQAYIDSAAFVRESRNDPKM
jgi:hypothetical protein